jgi:hypothetical protein
MAIWCLTAPATSTGQQKAAMGSFSRFNRRQAGGRLSGISAPSRSDLARPAERDNIRWDLGSRIALCPMRCGSNRSAI